MCVNQLEWQFLLSNWKYVAEARWRYIVAGSRGIKKKRETGQSQTSKEEERGPGRKIERRNRDGGDPGPHTCHQNPFAHPTSPSQAVTRELLQWNSQA